jgi:hypothetical protein
VWLERYGYRSNGNCGDVFANGAINVNQKIFDVFGEYRADALSLFIENFLQRVFMLFGVHKVLNWFSSDCVCAKISYPWVLRGVKS